MAGIGIGSSGLEVYDMIPSFLSPEDLPALALFQQKDFRGHETFLDGGEGTELRLALPQLIQSFATRGSGGWKVWSGTEWDGETHCLVPATETGTERDGVKLVKTLNGTSITVGSIRQGCLHAGREIVSFVSSSPPHPLALSPIIPLLPLILFSLK
jgi:hypothetical protein